MILLDTHAAIWFMRDDPALGKKTRKVSLAALEEAQLAVSAITFWEIALLIARRRLRSIDDPVEQRADASSRNSRDATDGDIAILAVGLDGLHTDPADRIIAATALTHNAMLITAYQTLLNWRSQVRRLDAES